MISLESVRKTFAGRVLFDDASLKISPGDRLGIVGPNGAGKSTLIALILGVEAPDAGRVAVGRDVTLGHLPQEIVATPHSTVLATALRPSGRLARVEAELGHLPDALAQAATDLERERLALRLAEAHAEYAELGGHDREARARQILAGLGFRPDDAERRLATFSGGFVARAELARLLVNRPDVLLLDEPTNHLDLESVLWLQEFLAGYRGALGLVSHDRAFLNALVTSIVDIEERRLTVYAGTYDDYTRERAARRAQLEAAAKSQERRIRETERFIERFRAKNTKATQVQSRIKALAREERIVVARQRKTVRFRFPQPPRTSETAIELRSVSKSYAEKRVYAGLDFTLKRGEKVVLVGPNGAGKSTLLKLLGGVIQPDSGERSLGLRVSVGYYAQHRHDMLDLGATVLENAFAASPGHGETFVRTLLGAFLFHGDDVNKKAAVLSGGEKSRLALARILLDPPSVLLMDEPTIHLDVPSVDALIAALGAYEGALCFVSHDVHFIRSVARRVVRVEAGKVTDYLGDWEYYLWKRAQSETPDGAAVNLPEPDLVVRRAGDILESDEGAAIDRSARGLREERRRAAEARNAIARRTRQLREEIEAIELEIDQLEREKAGLEGDLADPATYREPTIDVGEMRRRHAETEHLLAQRMQRWVELQAALDEARE
jgi:ATP-binding cassette subfamily F protein 3